MIVSKQAAVRQTSKVREYLRFLRRRKYSVALPALIFLAVGLTLYSVMPRRYVAEAVVALDPRRIQILSTEAVLSPLPQESPVLRTELDIINSRLMAERVLDRLERMGLEMPSPATSLTSTALQLFSGRTRAQAEAAAPVDRRTQIDRLLGNLTVSNDGRSYTIFIMFAATDPVYAAAAANAFGEAYLDYQADMQAAATRHATEWLGSKLVDLRKQLEASESAVEAFRRDAGLVIAEGTSLQAQQLSTLNTALIQARSERAAAEARYQTATTLARSDNGLDSFGAVLGSPIVQALRAEQAKVDRQLSEYEDTGVTKSAELPVLRSQQASLRQQIRQEVDRVVASLANEVEVERRKESGLETTLQAAEAAQSTVNAAQLQLNQLEREASANRTVYESYLTRYKQTIEQDGLALPEARLISQAEPPGLPAAPKLIPFVVLSLLAGSGLGLGVATLREGFDNRVRSRRDLEEITPLPVLDLVPYLRAPRTLPVHAAVVEIPGSAFGEAVRRLRSTLLLAPMLRRAKVLALTSPERGDGKTTLCLTLARSMALTGQKVILIDADLRNPMVASMTGVEPSVRLLDVVRDGRHPNDAITADRISPLHLIAAYPDRLAAERLLDEAGFAALLSQLRQRYDRIIIDIGSVEASTSTTQLGSLVDGMVLVTRWEKTTRSIAASSIRHLAFRGAPISSVILNGVRGHRPDRDEADHPAVPALPDGTALLAKPYKAGDDLAVAHEA
ncbi:polysaccharide biosynthesis tyrosine autokinase [Inquilinus sp. Marseille-Q2685]|uniref:GumC family protein n=1 Tax=Inquilinus sp. Marseille-Q2685 TaxID=2866581 RepID=UPI001CE4691C|nr:polysaccharide biosynthesis tyrosine autokinase [Inquilinus sp. Marseille-Q2685]